MQNSENFFTDSNTSGTAQMQTSVKTVTLLKQLRWRLLYCTEELLLLRGPSQHSLDRGGLLPLHLLSYFLLFSGNPVCTLLCTVIKLLCPCYSNHNWGPTRAYWMIYRWPGFLAVVWFGSYPTTFSFLPSVSKNSDTQEDGERETTCWRDGEGVGEEPNQTTAKKPGCPQHYKSESKIYSWPTPAEAKKISWFKIDSLLVQDYFVPIV
jgi:hypothetical protein